MRHPGAITSTDPPPPQFALPDDIHRMVQDGRLRDMFAGDTWQATGPERLELFGTQYAIAHYDMAVEQVPPPKPFVPILCLCPLASSTLVVSPSGPNFRIPEQSAITNSFGCGAKCGFR